MLCVCVKCSQIGGKRFSRDVVYGERGILRLERLPLTAPSCAMR